MIIFNTFCRFTDLSDFDGREKFEKVWINLFMWVDKQKQKQWLSTIIMDIWHWTTTGTTTRPELKNKNEWSERNARHAPIRNDQILYDYSDRICEICIPNSIISTWQQQDFTFLPTDQNYFSIPSWSEFPFAIILIWSGLCVFYLYPIRTLYLCCAPCLLSVLSLPIYIIFISLIHTLSLSLTLCVISLLWSVWLRLLLLAHPECVLSKLLVERHHGQLQWFRFIGVTHRAAQISL